MLINNKEFSLIPTEELTDLYNYKREYFNVCDIFKIPVNQRTWPNASTGIIERIHTYLTGYIGKRTMAERETGAAFPPMPPINIMDPEPKVNFKG